MTSTESFLADRTFAHIWANATRDFGPRTFLIFRDVDSGAEHSWTYSEFGEVVDRTAAFLISQGVKPGQAVHMCLNNCPAFIAIWYACAQLGAWFVPVDPTSGVNDIRKQCTRTSARVSFIHRDRVDEVAEVLDIPVIGLEESAADCAGGVLSEVSDGVELSEHQVQPHDRIAVMFTSGTTSEPKGVDLTQQNYAYISRAMASIANLTRDDRWLVVLPLFHGNAQFYCFAPAVGVGASVALMSRFSASGWVQQARETRATHASLFAAPIRMILARTSPDQEPAQLKHVWFAQNISAGHFEDFSRLAGVKPRQIYGMTETTAVVSAQEKGNERHDDIGHVIPGRSFRLIDPATDKESTTRGVLEIRGERGEDLFAGYLDAPEINERVFTACDDGSVYFNTGDILETTDRETLRFVGRKDDVIKVAGENVSLTEVEATLAEASGVLEVAVVAVPDEVRDVVPRAHVVLKEDATVTEADLDEFATANLPKAARPRSWKFTRELPRTSVGKIRRHLLATE